MSERLPDSISSYSQRVTHLLEQCEVTDEYERLLTVDEGQKQVLSLLEEARSSDSKVLIVGNGGSAAIASHLHVDLSKSARIRSLVFTETPMLTALSNDLTYSEAFASQVDLWKDSTDIMIAISSSGQSENIVRAIATAQSQGVTVITMTGFAPSNTVRRIGDLNFYIASSLYGLVETAHATLCHCFTDQLVAQTPHHQLQLSH